MEQVEWELAGGYLLEAHGIEHFTAREIADGRTRRDHHGRPVTLRPPPARLVLNAVRLHDHLLYWIRNELGDPAPVRITSWYRDSRYNRAVGGAVRSLHLECAAADIRKDGWSPSALARAVHEEHARSDSLGIGVYRNFVHVDVRGLLGRPAPARWVGNGIDPNFWG